MSDAAGLDTFVAGGPDDAAPRRARASTARRAAMTAAVLASYLGAAVYVLHNLLADLHGRRVAGGDKDQAVFEWMYAHTAHAIAHGSNPFITHAMNVPDGVNLLANTSMLAWGAIFSPLTLLFGAPVTFAVVEVMCLAATAASWWWLWRKLVASPFAAWVAGLFCGFAPGLVSQATGHTNMISQPLVPFIVWRSLRLARSERRGRDGALLALLIIGQFFVAPEVLFHTAIGLGVFVACWALFDPSVRRHWRPMAEGLAVAAAVSLAVLLYPMALQFGGPYSYRAISIASWEGNDITKIVTPSADTLTGHRTQALRYAWNIAEQNVNFGWLLVLAAVGITVALRRDRRVLAVGVSAAFIVWCSLGATITYHRRDTHIPTPWRVLQHVPLFDSLLASRLGLIAVPMIGFLLAMGLDRALAADGRVTSRTGLGWPTAAISAIVASLLPIAPTPIPTASRTPVPTFISDGLWQRFVGEGRTLVPAPLAEPQHIDPMAWQSEALVRFRMPGGYFLGPEGPDRIGKWPVNKQSLGMMMAKVGYEGGTISVTDDDRAAARDDLALWQADAIVLYDRQPRRDQLDELLTKLFGPGQRVADVLVWDVRSITRSS